MGARGRPRVFDRQAALQAMMDVFWQRGYEGAQLTHLTAAAGINPPSFYAAFGSKEAAFCEAVDLYLATVSELPRQALELPGTLRQSIQKMFKATIDVVLSRQPGGCLLILGVVNCLPGNEQARLHLSQGRGQIFTALKARIDRAGDEGDLPEPSDGDQMARFFYAIIQAISFQARDGASRPELESLIAPALLCLERSGAD